jgi:hypothetical protein
MNLVGDMMLRGFNFASALHDVIKGASSLTMAAAMGRGRGRTTSRHEG